MKRRRANFVYPTGQRIEDLRLAENRRIPMIGRKQGAICRRRPFCAFDRERISVVGGIQAKRIAVVIDFCNKLAEGAIDPIRSRPIGESVGCEEQEIDLDFKDGIYPQVWSIGFESHLMESDLFAGAVYIELDLIAVKIPRRNMGLRNKPGGLGLARLSQQHGESE